VAKGLFSGIKAISMGSAWAGPYVGRVLSEFGAEVFRISSPGRAPAPTRSPEEEEILKKKLRAEGMSEIDIEKALRPRVSYPANFQAGNYGIGLNVSSAKGKEIYKRLVSLTDIVIDGWSPRVMADFGLGYLDLKAIKPDIIYVSMPAMGMTGSEKDMRGWGTAIEYVSGLTSTRGYLNGGPHRAANFILDGISSAHILTAIMAALNYRARTGKGQHIDISQAECGTSIMGKAIMDYSMNRRVAQPMGNYHSVYAPHNCYRCRGDDRWVTIAVTSESEWQSLCHAMGNPEWTKNPKYTDMESRRQNQEELDQLIEGWTSQYDSHQVQEILQKIDVPAAAVVTHEELIMNDPQVENRHVYQWLTYHDGVADPVFRVPWVLPKNPTSLNWCAPNTGQHNDYLLRDILGMSEEEVVKLVEEKVIGVGPPAES
jgi:benzylsuccinate CoA-transferase BbsF subunit